MHNRGEGGSGFTLLEMLVVIVVLALALGLVLARGPAESPAASLESAVGQVSGALRLARSEAIAGDRPVAVTLDPAKRTVRIGTAPASRLPRAAMIVANREVRVTFAPDGTAAGGPVVLTAGSLKREIGVDWMTGRVEPGHDGTGP